MTKKKKKFDRVKSIKRISRDESRPYGKSGTHSDKREKRIKKNSTDDYLEELEEEIEEEK